MYAYNIHMYMSVCMCVNLLTIFMLMVMMMTTMTTTTTTMNKRTLEITKYIDGLGGSSSLPKKTASLQKLKWN